MNEKESFKNVENKQKFSKNLINYIESKSIKNNINNNIKSGDIIKIGYKIPEGEKDRIQFYEGIIICIQNRGLGKTFTIRRTIDGIGVEQIFLLNSPKIVSIVKKQASKIRRAKLYFLRNLEGKSTRLKIKREIKLN